MIEITVDAIISISLRGLVETFNSAAEHLFGYNIEENIGRNINVLMPEQDAGKSASNLNIRFCQLLFLTAKAKPEDRKKCLNVGASDYLAKPGDTNKLLDMINQWLLKANQL